MINTSIGESCPFFTDGEQASIVCGWGGASFNTFRNLKSSVSIITINNDNDEYNNVIFKIMSTTRATTASTHEHVVHLKV